MKVIFLDVDGVLNSEEFILKKVEKMGMSKVHWNFPQSEFCPSLMSNLNRIIKETSAQVVFSSSWRHGRTTKDIKTLLDSVGFIGEVVDKTPSLGNSIRGEEIQHWLDRHEIESFVILDDDNDMLESHTPNFVQTNFKHGLTTTCVEKAIKILNNT